MIDLIYLSCTILLPVIPAYLLFQALDSAGDVAGPLFGMKVRLGGAFAGYFSVLILIFVMYHVWHPPYHVWRVHGQVTDEKGTPIKTLHETDISLMPPCFHTYKDGGFDIALATTSKDYPTLEVGHEAFDSVTIVIDPNSKNVKKDADGHLTINRIELHKLPTYASSDETAPAQIPASEEPPPLKETPK